MANFAAANFAAASRQPEDIVEYDARTIWAFALVAAAALAYKYLPRWRSRSPYVEPAELKHRLDAGDDVVVVDVRTVGEYAGKGGHLPGAVNLPLGNLKARLEARDGDLAPLKDHPVYVHCTLDLRAARAARALRDAGFTARAFRSKASGSDRFATWRDAVRQGAKPPARSRGRRCRQAARIPSACDSANG
jgi:rhodanese-related sulfurtransferase